MHCTCLAGLALSDVCQCRVSKVLRPFHYYSLPRMLQAPDWPEQYKPIDVIQHPGET